MIEITETDRAYLAGILDGEGSFSIRITATGGFTARMDVGNKDLRLHEWLREKFEGADAGSDRGCLRTRWSNKKAMTKVLEAALPYLIIKREEAEIMAEWLRGMG